jgi:hypothetical protein
VLADAIVKFADQTADDIPAMGSPHFDVSMLVHADDGVGADASRGQVAGVQFTVIDDLSQSSARHLNELHAAPCSRKHF